MVLLHDRPATSDNHFLELEGSKKVIGFHVEKEIDKRTKEVHPAEAYLKF